MTEKDTVMLCECPRVTLTESSVKRERNQTSPTLAVPAHEASGPGEEALFITVTL